MPYRPGQSGNPSGRPKGSIDGRVRLRKALEGEAPEILRVMVAKALAGDVSAASLLLNRLIPAVRAESAPVVVGLTGTSPAERAANLVDAVAAGQIPSSIGAELVAALANVARLREAEVLEARLTALEERMGRQT